MEKGSDVDFREASFTKSRTASKIEDVLITWQVPASHCTWVTSLDTHNSHSVRGTCIPTITDETTETGDVNYSPGSHRK